MVSQFGRPAFQSSLFGVNWDLHQTGVLRIVCDSMLALTAEPRIVDQAQTLLANTMCGCWCPQGGHNFAGFANV